MDKAALLFVCRHNSARSQMAEGFARQMAPAGVSILSAGVEPALQIHPQAVTAMASHGIDLSDQSPKSIRDLDALRFDLVITLCSETDRNPSCPLMAGSPANVHWALDDPARSGQDEAALEASFRKSAEEIRQLVYNLFHRVYLEAFVLHKRNMDRIIDNLSEGVMAHDLDRIIFYFSRGAERLTGISATEAIGRDCHEVFIPRLCGDNCSFCDDMEITDFQKKCYATVIPEVRGERKELDVTVVPLQGADGKMQGVVASLSDKTEINRARYAQEDSPTSFAGIIGQTTAMKQVFQQIRDLAAYDAPVHIFGETGTGKELVAQAVHRESVRRDNPFVPINCGARPEGLVESELFGHVKGSFSGAVRDKKGRFELADKGTIFLDEISELPKNVQVKLLRFLQEGILEKVGSEKTITSDVRIISASNADLKKEVEKGNFRDDLFYRINVIPIVLPPLRERKNDIPLLVRHFVNREHLKTHGKRPVIDDEAMQAIMEYHWPGNIRELENAIQFAVIKCRNDRITSADLPLELSRSNNNAGQRGPSRKLDTASVKEALEKAGGNKSKAARLLDVGRATLYRFLENHPELNSGQE
ncbi:MAG: sigma 54-interacting transcriptional regulator [Desulfosudaceae bacterium]